MNKKTLILSGTAIIAIGIIAITFINLSVAKHPAENGNLVASESQETSQDVKKADLAFEKSGKVIFIAKKVGDQVSQGEVLAKINNADALVQYNQAKAGISEAGANLAAFKNSLSVAKLKLKGLKSNDKKIQKKQVSLAKNNVASQEALLFQTQETLVNAQNQLDRYSIKAPFDGIVTVQNIEIGEIASVNVPVISISAK
jgi:multidrug resistance efflux pump